MIVPQYWAEAKLRERTKARGQVTLRRFGWSNESAAGAQAMAEQRVAEAMEAWKSGQCPQPSEPKVPYNGADGVPIREEIIARHGETVITRNAYGSLCLNTPNVLFIDIDFASETHGVLKFLAWYFIFATGCIWALLSGSWLPVFIGLVVSLILFNEIAMHFSQLVDRYTGGAEKRAMKRIRKLVEERPHWHLRLYRTPRGFRILVMHDTFDPRANSTAALFSALGADKLYARMCHNQNCFRARVSPKPWRIGMDRALKPRPGVWPVKPERLPERAEWVAEYDALAVKFASCRFEESLGVGQVHAQAEAVRELHDELCRAESNLPLA